MYPWSICFHQTELTGICKNSHENLIFFPAVLLQSIKKWKEKQRQKKEGNLKEKAEKMLKEAWLQREEAQKQKAAEERKRQQAAIEEWKKQKAIAFAMEQASKRKLEEEKEKKQQKERQRQCHMKLLLERYTLQKKEKEELEKLEKEKREEAEKEERKRIAAEEITKFQERVRNYISIYARYSHYFKFTYFLL